MGGSGAKAQNQLLSSKIRQMKKDIAEIRKILEEHLASINENTSEIQALFDYLQELEIKIDKLSQRLDVTQLSQNQNLPKEITALSQTERKVFLVLYTEETPLSYKEIALRANIPMAIIPEVVSSLITKGIPFHRSIFNNQFFLKLEPQFKEKQAKENVVNLSLQSFLE